MSNLYLLFEEVEGNFNHFEFPGSGIIFHRLTGRHLTDATLDAIIECIPDVMVIDMSSCSFSEEV